MKNYKDLIFKFNENTAFIKINRPPNNYFDAELIEQIANILEAMDKDKNCRSVILHSEGKHFCAGADFSKSSFKEDSDTYGNLYKQAIRLFKTQKPIIAVVQGAAIGGGLGVALVADFRISCEEARFSANFSKLGFHQGFGITITLPRLVGIQKARWMLLTGRRITGKEAFDIGLCDYLVRKDNILNKAIDLASEINSSGPLGVQSIRSTLNRGLEEKIESVLKIELSEQIRLKNTEDFREGINASLERREPRFKGL